jgi:hypothetical protein
VQLYAQFSKLYSLIKMEFDKDLFSFDTKDSHEHALRKLIKKYHSLKKEADKDCFGPCLLMQIKIDTCST